MSLEQTVECLVLGQDAICSLLEALIGEISPGRLLTAKEAAEALGVGVKALRAWTRSGRVAAVRRKGRGEREIIRYRYLDLVKSLRTSGRRGTPRFEAGKGKANG